MPRYGSLAASTRLRFDQYTPFLQDTGFSVESWPLFSNSYLEKQYAGDRPGIGYTARRYLARAARLIKRRDIDLLWIGYEVFPYLPGFFDLLVRASHAPIVVDFDDAIFHNYDASRRPLVGKILGERLAPILRRANAVFCGNKYLRDYSQRFCSRTHIVPTVLDTEQYQPPSSSANDNKLQLGWIGTPSTWDAYVVPILPLLLEECARADAEFVAVGSGRKGGVHSRLIRKDWAENKEIAEIQRMDVCIMPLDESPWAKGKCGLKLIQYMACGRPVIASPIGVNCEIVEPGKNGFLADSSSDWRIGLRTLFQDQDKREEMGVEGRKKAESEFSLSAWGPRVAETLRQITQEGYG